MDVWYVYVFIQELEEVNEYNYLGSIVTGGGGADEDVTSRILRRQMWHLCSCIGFGKTRI
jgi:hypothetical protein